MALSGEVNHPPVEEKDFCNTELIEGLESLGSIAKVKSTGNRSVVAVLFTRPTEHSKYKPAKQQQ